MVFASWDSEESGLIGSVHFGEEMQLEDLNVEDGLIAYLKLRYPWSSVVFYTFQ